jgi:phosphoglucosamine mutase
LDEAFDEAFDDGPVTLGRGKSRTRANKTFFGTDGIRGVVNREPVTAKMAMNLGQAVIHLLVRKNRQAGNKTFPRPRVVIGQDTRFSSDMLSSALAAGVMSQGGDVYMAGVLPTPGLAHLTSSLRANVGVVISASHNPFEDNGIKVFDERGYKISDEVERNLEKLINYSQNLTRCLALPADVGRLFRVEDAVSRYVFYLKSVLPQKLNLRGLKIVLDCANGAAFRVAPAVFRELGAEVYPIADNPDGYNINLNCGSLHPEFCAQKVSQLNADLGVALDGDADRVIFIDGLGQVVNGDQILYLLADHLKNKKALAKNTMVSTVMSNLGLDLALKKAGIELKRTAVGDRYVSECLRQEGLNFGGEQSGHVIFLDHSTTGDGTLAALKTVEAMLETKRSFATLGSLIGVHHQAQKNVEVANPALVMASPKIEQLRIFVNSKLQDNGRVLIRASGTEPYVRVLIEGTNADLVDKLAKFCSDEVAKIQPQA